MLIPILKALFCKAFSLQLLQNALLLSSLSDKDQNAINQMNTVPVAKHI